MRDMRATCRLVAIAAAGALAVSAQTGSARSREPDSLRNSATRLIEFETAEGTWMSVDVSPDGRTIAFDLLGQLYVIPITGGLAKKISHSDGFFSQPRFGPHGRIAYVSDETGAENVWVANADGTSATQITREDFALFTSPSWTHDGKSILVSRQDAIWRPSNLWMYDAVTGAPDQLTHHPPDASSPAEQRKWARGPAASPHGRHIYYAESLRHITYDLMLPLWQIMRYEIATKKSTPVIQAPGSAFRPVLSPDGSKLVYGTRHQTQSGLRIQDVATGETRWLVYPIDRDEQESNGASRDILPGYAFTPDGKHLIVAYGGKIRRIDIEDGRATVVPFEVRVAQPIKPVLRFESRLDDSTQNIRLILDPSQSPDGKRLTFSALAQIHVMNFSDGKPRRLTKSNVPEFQPRWSPDGKWIAYVSWSDEGGHVWKSAVDGVGQPIRLTSLPAYYYDISWSPDGSRIVALRAPRQSRLEKLYLTPSVTFPDTALVSIAVTGGNVITIMPAAGYRRPHFADSSHRVYATGPEGLISVGLDGSGYRHHLRIEHNSRGIRNTHSVNKSIVMRRDHRAVLTTVGDRLYSIALGPYDAAEAKPRTVNLDVPSVDAPNVPITTISRVGADYFDWADQGATVTWSIGSTFFRSRSAGDLSRPDEIAVKLPVQPFRPATAIVLRGARIVSMATAGVIENGDVVMKGNRIESVGPVGAQPLPAGAQLMSAEGMTVIPGLIDTHAHFYLDPTVLDLTHWSLTAKLAYGVTTVRDPQSSSATILGYQDLIDSGMIHSPRVLTTGPGILSGSSLRSLEDALTVVRKYKEYYQTGFIKAYAAGNRRERRWITEACRRLGMMVTTEGASDLKLDLTHAIDGFTGNEHAYATMPLYNDVVQFLVRSGIYTTPTLMLGYGGPQGYHYFFQNETLLSDPRIARFMPPGSYFRAGRLPAWFQNDQFAFPMQAAAAVAIARAGGRIPLGTDNTGTIDVHWTMWALVNGGASPMEALRAATSVGADVLGYSRDLGSIAPGKLADLVVLSKNPLDDIHNTTSIRFVIRNGVVYDANTMNEAMSPKNARPLPWWIADSPDVARRNP